MATTEPTTLEAADLYRLRLIDDPRLSPRGDLVAYVEIYNDPQADRQLSEVVVIATTDGSPVWRSGPGAVDRLPRWSPDSRLAFVSDRDNGAQCWLLERPSPGDACARRLTELAGAHRAIADLDWSPGGDKLVMLSTVTVAGDGGAAWRTDRVAFKLDGRRGFAHTESRLHLVGLDGAVTAEHFPPGAARCPRFSPDGSTVAYIAPHPGPGARSQGSAIWVVNSDPSARPEVLASRGAPIQALCWSPDGRAVAFIGQLEGEHQPHNQHVFVADAGTGTAVDVTPGMDRSAGVPVRADDPRGCGVPALAWSARTKRIYFEVAEGGRGPLGWASPVSTTGALSDGRGPGTSTEGGGEGWLPAGGRMYHGDHVCLAPCLAPDGPALALVLTSPVEPGALYLGSEDGAALRRLAGANDWLTERELGLTRHIEAYAPDGTALEGWLTLPSRACGVAPPWPLVVTVHGGPHYAVGWRFSFDAQRLAGRGLAVLGLNPRGSLGYGEDFAAATAGDWGGADFGDIVAVLDTALALGVVDPERTAVQGVSYGGYMAQWAVTRTDRFRAAISENGMSNLLSQWGTGADGGAEVSSEMLATPWSGAARLVERSPLSHADRVRTPLLLVHSELDQNCPAEQSEQMYAALKYLGRPAELAVLEGEGHLVNLVGRPSRRLARAAIIDDYLDRRLRGPGVRPWT